MVLKGVYCLCIRVKGEIDVEVGALGTLRFHEGLYIYVGSALNGLEARILRHIGTSHGTNKVIRWHIDYLLKELKVWIESVYVLATDERVECVLANEVFRRGEPIKGFGCSDCRCVSHLFEVEGCGFLRELGMERWPQYQREKLRDVSI
jgi:Uri superfamily endonuclease